MSESPVELQRVRDDSCCRVENTLQLVAQTLPIGNVIRNSNPDFRINPDMYRDVCRSALKKLWIHFLVGLSHFANYRKRQQVIVWATLRNLPIFYNGEKNKKIIWNPHPGPDYHQKLITSRVSRLAHAYHVSSTFVIAVVSYLDHRTNERTKLCQPWWNNIKPFHFLD